MRALLAALLLAPCLASAVAVRAPAPAAFPRSFLGTIWLSAQCDGFYASRLLGSLDAHLRSVASMRSPEAVRDYLVTTVAGTVAEPSLAAARLREGLGREPMPAPRAAALLLANALARPDQFHEILAGLEKQRPGLGSRAALLLAGAKGNGDPRLIARLRIVGHSLRPVSKTAIYGRTGELSELFDGADAGLLDSDVAVEAPAEYSGYGEDGRPRRGGLKPSPRVDLQVR